MPVIKAMYTLSQSKLTKYNYKGGDAAIHVGEDPYDEIVDDNE